MKITNVRAIPLAIPTGDAERHSPWWGRQARQVIVEVATDEGIVGLGEAFAMGGQGPVCRVIEDALKPLLLGHDPTRVAFLADLMQRSTAGYGRRGIGMHAVSGVEIALWDILGKARNLPLYEILGGLTRPRLPAYASLLRYNTPADVIGLSEDRFVLNLDRYGNTSAASIPIAVCEAVRDGRLRPDDNVVLVGFGAGLTWGAGLIQWDATPPAEPTGIARFRRQLSYSFAGLRSTARRGLRRVEGLLFGSQSPEGGQQPPKRARVEEPQKTKDPV